MPSTYLQQFTGLHMLELGAEPDWQQQGSSTTPQCGLQGATFWTEMIQGIPTSCCWLRLKTHGAVPASLGTLSQLSNLQSLYIYSYHRGDVSLEALASLTQLQLLSLVGLTIKHFGSSKVLPTGIMNLQLKSCSAVPLGKGFCLQDLSLFPKLTSLGFSYCHISFGQAAKVVDLHHLKVLALEGAIAEGSAELIVPSLTAAQELQDLNLRALCLVAHTSESQLGKMLPSLQSLQKLDVTKCRHVHLGPSEYAHLRLRSLACHYSQLSIVEDVPFRPFSLGSQAVQGNTIWPSLQVQGVLGDQQHWINTLPVTELTHLTFAYHRQCLLPWTLDFEVLPNLLYLDVSLLSFQCAGQHVRFAASQLQELYIRGMYTECAMIDLVHCTSLTRLGIRRIEVHTLQDLALPTSLERLCLYNVLTTSFQPELHLLTNLEYPNVGTEPATQDFVNHLSMMERLPKLPPSLLTLDIQA